MRKYSKTRKGFTLVEVMLAIAIMVMTAGVFFSLIVVVMKSHLNVVNTNDCEDFALLNARAFENAVINAKEVGSGSNVISVSGNQLCKNGAPLFDLEQYKIEPGHQDKWTVEFEYNLSDKGVCEYTIKLSDNTGAISNVNNYVYEYNNTFYIPHCTSTANSGSTFNYSDY